MYLNKTAFINRFLKGNMVFIHGNVRFLIHLKLLKADFLRKKSYVNSSYQKRNFDFKFFY